MCTYLHTIYIFGRFRGLSLSFRFRNCFVCGCPVSVCLSELIPGVKTNPLSMTSPLESLAQLFGSSVYDWKQLLLLSEKLGQTVAAAAVAQCCRVAALLLPLAENQPNLSVVGQQQSQSSSNSKKIADRYQAQIAISSKNDWQAVYGSVGQV